MKIKHSLLIYLLLFVQCDFSQTDKQHVFYLHGRIVEVQGVNAVSEQFGPYQYTKIIAALEDSGAVVHHELRTAATDFADFCLKVSRQIDHLIADGVAANQITVIGASKGGVMAMNIAHQNEHPINYVLLAANNEAIERENDWNLHGRILGIYEKTDQLSNKDYQHWINRSTNAKSFEQQQINTGLGHGFLYRPLKEWLEPALNWAKY